MTLEEMTLMPDPQMPTAAARPSLEDLFRQGNVQVTPGAVGPEAMRGAGGPAPTAMEAGYGGLADLYQMGAEAPAGTNIEQLNQLMGIAAPQQQRLDAERVAQQKMEMEAGAPEREAQAKLTQAKGEQPLKLAQIQETGRAQTAVDLARVQAEHQARLEQLQNTPFTNPLFLGKTPKEIAAMSPQQYEAYKGSILGSTKIKDFGSFLQALATAKATSPGIFDDNSVAYLIAREMAHQSGQSIDNYLTQFADPKTGRPAYKLKLDYGLTPTAAGARVSPSQEGGIFSRAMQGLSGMVTPTAPPGPGGPPMAAEVPYKESQPGLSDFLTRPPMGPMTPPGR